MACVVRVNTRIIMNKTMISPGSLGANGADNWTGYLQHEKRHVMADAYAVKLHLVAAIKTAPKTFNSADDCHDKSRELRENLKNKMKSLGAHDGDIGANRYSPTGGFPFMGDLGVNSWLSEMKRGGESVGETSVIFDKCKQ